MKITSLISWLLIVCLPISAWSHSAALPDDNAAKVKLAVQKRGTGEHSRVTVTLRDKTEVKGYVSEISAESFLVTDKKSGRVTTVAYQDVLKVRKQGMSTGAKIAIGAGIAGVIVLVSIASIIASNEGY